MASPEQITRLKELIARYGAQAAPVLTAKPIDAMRAEILLALGGWPQRIYCKGGVKLFVDTGAEEVVEFTDAKDFMAWLQEYSALRVFPGQDEDGINFVTMEGLYKSCGRAADVREWKAVDAAPHWPPYPGHYVTWEPPAGYTPKG